MESEAAIFIEGRNVTNVLVEHKDELNISSGRTQNQNNSSAPGNCSVWSNEVDI